MLLRLIQGNNTLKIKNRVLEKKQEIEPDFLAFDFLETSDKVEALETIISYSFSNKKIVILFNYEPENEDLKQLQSIPINHELILINPQIDRRKKIGKILNNLISEKEEYNINSYDIESLNNLIRESAKYHGIKLEKSAGIYLRYAVGIDPLRVDSECFKLALWQGNDSALIPANIVKDLVTSATADVWRLADAIRNVERLSAFNLLNEILNKGVYSAELIGGLRYKFRQWLLALTYKKSLPKRQFKYLRDEALKLNVPIITRCYVTIQNEFYLLQQGKSDLLQLVGKLLDYCNYNYVTINNYSLDNKKDLAWNTNLDYPQDSEYLTNNFIVNQSSINNELLDSNDTQNITTEEDIADDNLTDKSISNQSTVNKQKQRQFNNKSQDVSTSSLSLNVTTTPIIANKSNPQNKDKINRQKREQLLMNETDNLTYPELDTINKGYALEETKYLDNIEDLEKAIILIKQAEILGFDLETVGIINSFEALDPYTSKIRLISIAIPNQPVFVIDLFKINSGLEKLKSILEGKQKKIAHNAKFELKHLLHNGIKVKYPIFDTMIAHLLTVAGLPEYKDLRKQSLKSITKKYLNIELNKEEQTSDWSNEKLSSEQIYYSANDSRILLPLKYYLHKLIENQGLDETAVIEFKCLPAIARMEYNGILIDSEKWLKNKENAIKQRDKIKAELAKLNFVFPPNLEDKDNLLQSFRALGIPLQKFTQKELKQYRKHDAVKLYFQLLELQKSLAKLTKNDTPLTMDWLENQIEQIKDKINTIKAKLLAQLPPIEIDINSPTQLLKGLQLLGIPASSTDARELKILAKDYSILNLILEYRKYNTLVQNFGDSQLEYINPSTGRIHPEIRQLGAVSGRITQTKPTMQNLPREVAVRSCFIPAPGYKYVIADYSQIELRITAEIAHEKSMLKAYQEKLDLHKLTGTYVTGKPLENITKEDRQVSKSANFGLIYGMQAEGFRNYAESSYGVVLSLEEATEIRDKFFAGYSDLITWHKKSKSQMWRLWNHTESDEKRIIKQVNANGRIATMTKPNFNFFVNFPVQSLGADILKTALANLVTALEKTGAKIVHCVHDEIILEAPESEVEKVAVILEKTMIDAGVKYLHKVPVEADANIGNSWADK